MAAKVRSSGPARPPLSFTEAKAALADVVTRLKTEHPRVQFALGGGFAMQAYGSSRLTKDVDLVVSQVPSFAKRGTRLNIGGHSVEIAGVPFDFIDRKDEYRDLYDAAIDSAKKVTGFDIPVVTPEFLVAMKMVAARPKDLVDLDFLLSSVKLNTKLLQKIVLQHLGKYAVTDLHNRAQTARWLKSQGRLD